MTSGEIDCKTCRAALREHALGLLESQEAAAMTVHLEECGDCRAALAAEESRLGALATLPEADAPPDLASKTVQLLLQESKTHAPRKWFPQGAIIATAVAALLIVIVAPALFRAREAARRSSSAGNLKQIAIVFKMYSNESRGGKFPSPVLVDGTFVPKLQLLFPKYMKDPRVFINPRLPEADVLTERLLQALEAAPPDWDTAHAVIAENYNYMPWMVTDEADLMLLAARYPELDGSALDNDLAGEAGEENLFRLKVGIERFLITDINNPAGSARAQSSIPVMFEVVPAPEDAKRSLGCNVLFMDGHVEFIKYGERFPILPETNELFGTGE